MLSFGELFENSNFRNSFMTRYSKDFKFDILGDTTKTSEQQLEKYISFLLDLLGYDSYEKECEKINCCYEAALPTVQIYCSDLRFGHLKVEKVCTKRGGLEVKIDEHRLFEYVAPKESEEKTIAS
jgi:hypothetical protein